MALGRGSPQRPSRATHHTQLADPATDLETAKVEYTAGMSTPVTVAVMRTINKLGGKHGEYAASFVLHHTPHRWVPSTGVYRVRRNGLHWTLDLDDNLQRRLYLVGAYESLTLAVLFSRLRPDDVFLDVGANIGAIALPIAQRLRRPGRVIAVEAAKDTAARLRKHVAVNNLDDRVRVVEAALSDREGEARLRLSDFGPGDVGTRTLEGDLPTAGDPVRITTGDILRRQLEGARFDILKVDVEGHERFVLDGFAETFAECPPRIVVLEILAGHQERSGGSSQLLLDRMSELGYGGLAIRHRGLRPVTPEFSGNVIFEMRQPRF